VKLDFTFSPGSGQYVRAQKHQMIMETADKYRARERPRSAHQVRSDVAGGAPQRSLHDQVLRR
jgi:Holliday junction resolvase-like predicted endonuclease